ncbi:MAG: hypothetical protein ACOC4J_06615 [Bacteroidota bacterium]
MEEDLTLCIERKLLPSEWIKETFFDFVPQASVENIFKNRWV